MAVESRVTQEEIKKEPEKPIDREKVRRPDEVAVGRRGGERGLRAGVARRPRRLRVAGCAASACALAFTPVPQTCPLLLRVFTTNNGRHHRMDEFSRGNVPSSELQIYTW